jgi:hypothetical protein
LTCRKIGVPAGSSTFEPFVMNASQSFFAAPKYPNPIAVPTDAWAAPAPSKPKPFRPSPERDHAVFCRVLSATALDGPISEAGARSRAKVEVVALISPSLPTNLPNARLECLPLSRGDLSSCRPASARNGRQTRCFRFSSSIPLRRLSAPSLRFLSLRDKPVDGPPGSTAARQRPRFARRPGKYLS